MRIGLPSKRGLYVKLDGTEKRMFSRAIVISCRLDRTGLGYAAWTFKIIYVHV